MKHRDQRILDKSLDSPKSDETELVPISSNKANIQGTVFHPQPENDGKLITLGHLETFNLDIFK